MTIEILNNWKMQTSRQAKRQIGGQDSVLNQADAVLEVQRTLVLKFDITFHHLYLIF